MNKEKLLEIFPEINFVGDSALREKCIETWLDVLEVGQWEKKGIRNCPVAGGAVSSKCVEKCIDHCRHVAQLCKMFYDNFGSWCKQLGKFDENIFLAAAVLHDVGKFLEYDFIDGKECHSEKGIMFRHVTSGAYYAKKHGLPDKVVYMVLAHSDTLSPECGNAVQFPELTALRQLDFLCFSMAKLNFPV